MLTPEVTARSSCHVPARPVPAVLEGWRSGLIVSCQADPGSPLRDSRLIAALAQAAEAGGARAVRIQGLDDLRAVRAAVTLPVVGLVRRPVAGSPVFITPAPDDVRALAQAGAAVVAFDATRRPRPHPVAELVAAAHEAGALAMADCATLDDARAAVEAGADMVSTTLSGYTDDSPSQPGPDLELVRLAARLPVPVIAEGRISSPAEAAEALRCGAFAVVVGTAITRPDVTTAWYARALADAALESLATRDRP